MYYRITKVTHKPGVQDQIRDYLKSKEDMIKDIIGLQSVTLIKIDATSSMGISIYENEQQVINAEDQFKEIMGGMMSFMTAPPEIKNGNQFWKYEL